jgi:ankyrin repeat protein
MNWPIHARLHESLLLESSNLLDANSVPANYKAWLQVYHNNMPSNSICSYDCDPPLYYSALFGLAAELTEQIRHGTNVNVRGGQYGTPLQAAAAVGNSEIVSILLENNATLSAQNNMENNVLHMAVEHGHESIAISLLKADGDRTARNAQNQGENMPLHLAAKNCHPPVAELLMLKGADASI